MNLDIIRELIQYFFKLFFVKVTFNPTVFEILLSKCMSVLSLSQRGNASERIKFSMKNKKSLPFVEIT